ncbi:hypothetical protein E2C01_040386 [Portunus trituberculatus]|uniref:Uncharacterized protein n=1 Tax=Portunus trituberculatus TaxID=210409 RepID=A0A5B7FHD7_PORTR|nr:hypothetical protein [Portunus trituberculatus]
MRRNTAKQGRPWKVHAALHLREPHGGSAQDVIPGPPVDCQRGSAPVVAPGWCAILPRLTVSSQRMGQAVYSLISGDATS